MRLLKQYCVISRKVRVTIQVIVCGDVILCVIEHVSFWGDRRDYWHYLSTGVGGMKQLDDIVKKVQSLAHVSLLNMH